MNSYQKASRIANMVSFRETNPTENDTDEYKKIMRDARARYSQYLYEKCTRQLEVTLNEQSI